MLTRKCNYRCRGCNVWNDQSLNELSTEQVKSGLDILEKIGVLEIVFSGGNPLLREDIKELLDYASERFITTIYDNGSTAVKKIEALQNVDFIAISLDTLDKEKNDYLKGISGAWKNAMDSIEILKKEGINIGVSPTISQINLYDIVDFTKYFIEREVPVWYCLYWYDYPFKNGMFSIGKESNEYRIKDRKALVKVFDDLLELKKTSEYVYITNKTLEALRELALTGERKWECKALNSFLIVDHLGRVAGCHSRESVASIFDLPKLWKTPEFDRLRDEYSHCTKCSYLCYIFYSVHSGLSGTIDIIRDQWKNAKVFLADESKNKSAFS